MNSLGKNPFQKNRYHYYASITVFDIKGANKGDFKILTFFYLILINFNVFFFFLQNGHLCKNVEF